jgi:hypothetical protein
MYYFMYFYSSLFLALHVSGAIRQSETDRAKSVRVSQPGPAPVD